MLTDRAALVERELKAATKQAADMYLSIVIHNRDVHSAEYQTLRDRVATLEFDRNMINQLIIQGHK